jgi:hypothetical protein
MWTEKDDKDRQSYVCKTCHGNAMIVFKEPMARKPRSKGPRRIRIAVMCVSCKGKEKRVGWQASGSGLRRRLARRKK